MLIKSILGVLLIWVGLTVTSFSVSKHLFSKTSQETEDKVGADEQKSRYEGLDIEDICKNAKNPHCKAIINDYCHKSCRAKLCAKQGTIRSMCRLMCEAEDLPPECLKMGNSITKRKNLWSQSLNSQQNQMWPEIQQWTMVQP